MKTIEKWKWRIRWAGKTVTTRIHMTWDEVRIEHPEATRVDGSLMVFKLPETDAERDAAMQPRGRR